MSRSRDLLRSVSDVKKTNSDFNLVVDVTRVETEESTSLGEKSGGKNPPLLPQISSYERICLTISASQRKFRKT